MSPRNHPALVGTPGARLTLAEVLGTWRAAEAVKSSDLNVENKAAALFKRFRFLAEQYERWSLAPEGYSGHGQNASNHQKRQVSRQVATFRNRRRPYVIQPMQEPWNFLKDMEQEQNRRQ